MIVDECPDLFGGRKAGGETTGLDQCYLRWALLLACQPMVVSCVEK
jgi:hypothetical protein